jgi:hypothetical protein
MKRLIIVLLLMSCCYTVASTQVVKLSTLQAFSDGSVITLRWNTEDESNVTNFVIERRVSTSGAFIELTLLNPKGSSLYEFVDKTAFRSTATLYQYQIKVKFSNGNPEQVVGPISVSHSVNSVKRTWGSIKAMFR